MGQPTAEFRLADADATTALGQRLAAIARAGDTLLLDGDLGAGKTHFARAFVQACLSAAGQPVEDVPSPTFTLVQTYQAGGTEIWHADLYRLSGPDDTLELGLDDAVGTAILLVEWPDRWGEAAPSDAVRLRFAPDGDGRRVTLTASDARWHLPDSADV